MILLIEQYIKQSQCNYQKGEGKGFNLSRIKK